MSKTEFSIKVPIKIGLQESYACPFTTNTIDGEMKIIPNFVFT